MPVFESQVPAPTSSDACSLADWAEAVMLTENRTSSSRSFLRRRLQSILFTEPDEVEVQVELLLSEVGRRRSTAEHTYPFAWTAVGLSRVCDMDETPYEFLLWLSISPNYRRENRYSEIDELFDNLVRQALTEYLGPNAVGVRFGSPPSGGRPSGFADAVKWLARLLQLETGVAVPRPRVKDGGVDVVVWRPFRDGRTGFVAILCQCTVAQDWTPKARDIVPTKWKGWIDFGREPLTAIAVPFAIPRGFDRWDEIRRTVNVIFDRMRIAELIHVNSVDDLAKLRAWSDRERSLLVTLT